MTGTVAERMDYWMRRVNAVQYHNDPSLFVSHEEYRALLDLERDRLIENPPERAMFPAPKPGEPVTDAPYLSGTRIVIDGPRAAEQLARFHLEAAA